MSFFRGSSQPKDQTQVSHIADRFLIVWATREAQPALTENLLCIGHETKSIMIITLFNYP